MNFSNVIGVTLPNNLQVIKIEHNNVVLWQSGGGEDYSTKYFFVEDASGQANTVSITKASSNSSTPSITLEKSTDGTTWETLGTTTYGTPLTATVPANGRLYLRAVANQWGNNTTRYNTIGCSGDYNVGGNIMSLLYGDSFLNQTSLPNYTYTFFRLFYNSTTLKSAEHLVLPATTLANYCYRDMFRGCTGLTTAPELSTTTLAQSCYSSMFYGCTSLETAPELPATTLVSSCYNSMFNGCSSLNYVKALFTSGWTSSQTSSWLNGVAASGTLVLNGGFTGDFSRDVSGLPSGWDAEYTYLTAPTITQSGNDVTITNEHYLADIVYTVQPTGESQGSPVTVTGSTTFTITDDCVIRAYETDSTGSQSSVTTYNATADFSTEYFFIEDLSGSSNSVSFKQKNTSAPNVQFSTSTDKTTWTSRQTNTSPLVTIPANGRLYVKATCNQWATSYPLSNYITCTGLFKIGGNIMSLLYGDNFAGTTALPSGTNYTYTFCNLFNGSTNLKKAHNLVMPATSLRDYCYAQMFYGTGLTTAPELPATTLATYCYYNMFGGCTGLTTAPELPVTTLATYCYSYMFYGCTSLTTAPELPATTLADYCYQSMFRDCTGLTTAPELPATTLATYCYNGMFRGCTGLTTAPELPVTTLATYCYSYMFYDCTGLTTAPELPATTLTNYCYRYMFSGCSSLNNVKCLATNVSATNCTTNWLNGVAASGTFTKAASMSNWTTGANGIPSGWTVQNA